MMRGNREDLLGMLTAAATEAVLLEMTEEEFVELARQVFRDRCAKDRVNKIVWDMMGALRRSRQLRLKESEV